MWAYFMSRARRAVPRTTPGPGRSSKRRALRLESLEDRCLLSTDVVLQWNQVFLDTFKADRVLPLYFARQAAIVHTAMYDAVNDIDRSYAPFFADIKAPGGASLEAAAAQAAHDTMTALFPAHQAAFDATLAADLTGIAPGRARLGVAVGQAVAQQILAWRSNDGSTAQVTYVPGTAPGDWQPTPPAFAAPVAPQWGNVTPFGIPSDSAFRPPAPPALTSAEYTAAFDEVKSLGAVNSTTRTAEQSAIAKFWYGAAGTFTAPGYWNQIAQQVAEQRGDSLVQNARLFALLNMAQADATFAVWDTKYTYNLWRPVTAIRAADTDSNPDTAADPGWTPFLATPAHPSYSSGHSGVSGAAAAVLAAFFGSDAIPFSFSSDSLPGVTRSYASFSAAVQECSDSRVYAGIHWRFDVMTGQAMGNAVGNYIVTHLLLPDSEGEDGGGSDSAFRLSRPGNNRIATGPNTNGLASAFFQINVQPAGHGSAAAATSGSSPAVTVAVRALGTTGSAVSLSRAGPLAAQVSQQDPGAHHSVQHQAADRLFAELGVDPLASAFVGK